VRHLEIYLGKQTSIHIYFFIEDYKAITKLSKIVIFLLCGIGYWLLVHSCVLRSTLNWEL